MTVHRGQRWGLSDGFGYDENDDPGTYDPRRDRGHSASRPTGRPAPDLRVIAAERIGNPCGACGFLGEPCAFHQDGPS